MTEKNPKKRKKHCRNRPHNVIIIITILDDHRRRCVSDITSKKKSFFSFFSDIENHPQNGFRNENDDKKDIMVRNPKKLLKKMTKQSMKN